MVARPTPPPTVGLILAGGLGRRMGGADKPLLDLAGRPLAAYVAERLRPQCPVLVVNANGDAGRYAAFGIPVVPDGVVGSAGPLSGVLAGLDWAAAHRPDLAWMASAAADTPFLPADFVGRLHVARLQAGLPLACAASGGRTHPTNALWPVALRDDLRAALLDGERKIDRWTARHGIATAEWPAEPADPFFNVNRPEDLAKASLLLPLHGPRQARPSHEGG